MRNVAIVLFEDVEVLDFAGPFEIFSVTGRRSAGGPPFNVYTVAETDGLVPARNNLLVQPHFTFSSCPPPDIVVMPGGRGTVQQQVNPVLLDWLRQQNARVELMTSVCSGSVVLGAAGLLDGLKATTHHTDFDALRAAAPAVTAIENVRYVDNGHIVTSAGVQAGMDMSLHVVARLLGEDVARETARYIEYVWEPERYAHQ
jgi:transcriptional regulator GlxA family with amidase domain